MTLASKLTMGRIVCIPFFIFFLFFAGLWGKLFALLIFMGASFSDFLDGWFARKRNEVTSIGKIADPVADKILVYSAFISFIQLRLIPFWMVIIIMGRDFWIMGLRVELAEKKIILSASRLAKLKTFFEDVAVFFILFALALEGFGARIWAWGAEFIDSSGAIYRTFGVRIWAWGEIAYLLIGIATLLALTSGIQYWLENRRYLE